MMNVNAHNEVTKLTRELKVKKPQAEVATFLTGAAQLGSWLSPVKTVDAQLGGRIEFRAEVGFEHGATYELLDMPNHVILNSEKFGLIDVRFSEASGSTLVQFTFSKPAEEGYEKLISETVTRFIAMVNYR